MFPENNTHLKHIPQQQILQHLQEFHAEHLIMSSEDHNPPSPPFHSPSSPSSVFHLLFSLLLSPPLFSAPSLSNSTSLPPLLYPSLSVLFTLYFPLYLSSSQLYSLPHFSSFSSVLPSLHLPLFSSILHISPDYYYMMVFRISLYVHYFYMILVLFITRKCVISICGFYLNNKK